MPYRDIFIDNNVAKNFCHPYDIEYKKLINWLFQYREGSQRNAYLVVSNRLLAEYCRSSGSSWASTSIGLIIAKMTIEGRLIKINNERIKEFERRVFKSKIKRNLRCHKKDWAHVCAVLMSWRKFALSMDDDFIEDLKNFPGFTVVAEKRPELIPYDS